MKHHCLLLAPVFWLNVAFAEPIPLQAVTGQVELRDLANVASTLGVHFKIFDYEAPAAHCIHFFVEEKGPLREERHDAGGECGSGGPQRLTVQWRIQEGELTFHFFRYHRDINQGGSFGGTTILVDGNHTSQYRVAPPLLDLGQETLLVHSKFGDGDDAVELKVLAELRANPTGSMGTE
jgi:hypothetical protein